jgi:uncharacterized protein (UPF0332 family)
MTEAQEALLKKAAESLRASEHLAGAGYYEFAMARAHYTMFYLAQALLLGQGLTFKKHSSLLAAFGQYLVKPGIIPAHLHRNLITAYNARIESDYEPGGRFTAQDAALRSNQAAEFLALTEEKLGAA